MKMKEINTSKAPSAIGPYSQAISLDNLVFVSGQLPVNFETGEFDGDDITVQTKRSLENVKAILQEAGLEMKDVVKTTVFLQSMDDFAAMNQVYASYFESPYPARSSIEVAKLPKGANVEIEVIAAR
ncbi:RidA family protein [Lachnospiraceae bacterium OttesenSCG-928-D06]|nr:RidA family protein [Lachnospiraceae bacterium OttesenSCG-928-D06]